VRCLTSLTFEPIERVRKKRTKERFMCVEDKYAQTIAIVYPAIAPSDAYNLPTDRAIKTHVTVSLLGEISEAEFSKEDLIITLRNIEWETVEAAEVEKLELFGINNDFLVLLLNSPSLQNNWKRVNEALTTAGITSLDKYPTYRPHITLMENFEDTLPTPSPLPPVVKVGFPELWWGNEAIPLK
jgi:2'-5' RNA ligase